MNRFLPLLLLAALSPPFLTLLRAEMRETRSMAEVLAAADANTLVVMDIDNTILEPAQELGSDQWYGFMANRLVSAGRTPEQVKQVLVPLWKNINRVTAVVPVEPVTPGLIRKIQSEHVRVMGLTSRHIDFVEPTVMQLGSIGVDFRQSPLAAVDLRLSPTVQYAGGILYVTDGPKGAAFKALLAKLRLRPARVLFVDDKLKHVQDMEATLSELGIPHLEFRYGATDAKVRAFNPAIADVQLRFFGRILTDGAAAALVQAVSR